MAAGKSELSLVVLILTVLFYSAACLAGTERWWEKQEEGWFFYREKLETEPENKPEENIPVSPGPPLSLFSEVMKKRGEELLSRAMEEPTLEKVKAYMEHNRQMMALSRNFSLVWQRVLMSHPELLSGLLNSDSDKDIYYQQSAESKKEALWELATQAGLFFFYDTTCSYCVRQAKHLRAFLEEYPFFIVKSVTINGELLPEFPEAIPDNGIAARLGITAHPAIFLSYPPDRFERVTAGLVTPGELRDKLLWFMAESAGESLNMDAKESPLLDGFNPGGGQCSKQ